MKRIVLGVIAGLSVFAIACGSAVAPQGAECTKYLACAEKLGGTYASAAKTSYGADSACVKEPSVKEACEAGCKSSNESIKTSGLAADAGCA